MYVCMYVQSPAKDLDLINRSINKRKLQAPPPPFNLNQTNVGR